MSANNHDNGDPNNVRYARNGNPTKTQISNLTNLLDIDETQEDYNLMQVYLMAKALPFDQFQTWFNKSREALKQF